MDRKEAKELLNNIIFDYQINHFEADELLDCTIDIPTKDKIENIIPTLVICDDMRNDLGFPITLTDFFRTWDSHEEIYKRMAKPPTKTSLHLVCNALDCRASNGSRRKLGDMKKWLEEFTTYKGILIDWKGKQILLSNEIMGLGFSYSTFIHLDTRGVLGRSAPARW